MNDDGASEDPFSPEHNWCDRECERCGLAGECSLVRRTRGQRWALRQRGVDPDSPEGRAIYLDIQLEAAAKALAQLGEEEGFDVVAALERPPTFTQKRLTRAALDLIREIGRDDDAIVEASLLNMKIARIGGYLDAGDPASMDVTDEDAPWRRDGGPNLLLIEHLIGSLAAQLAQRRRADALLLLARLEILLEPLLTRVEPLRPYLAARLAAGRAPSPFAVVPERHVDDGAPS